MRDEIFKSLEARWHEFYDQYEVVKAALPPIIRWEWASRERYDPRPFYFHRHYFPRGRIIKPPPEHDRPWQHYFEYGFDKTGRVILERDYFGMRISGETFYTYTPDNIEIVAYSQYQNQLFLSRMGNCAMRLDRLQHYADLTIVYATIGSFLAYPGPGQEGKTVTAEEAWAQLLQYEHAIQWHDETYEFRDRRLVHIQNYVRYVSNTTIESEDLIEYDTAGRLEKITRVLQTGKRLLLYRKRQPRETREVLAERTITKLVKAIPQIVAKAGFTEPLFCLTLNYYSDTIGSFPPTLLPGFESDRQKAIRELPPHYLRSGFVWVNMWDDEAHPDIPYPPLPITDPEVLEACENLKVDVQRGRDYDYTARTLRAIARELNKLDWSQYAPVTSDFIVYDCDDTEHTRPAVSLRYSGATEQQLTDWRKRGVL